MKARQKRITYIQEALEAADGDARNARSYELPYWRGSTRVSKRVVWIDAGYLMFRVENSRTIRQQLAYLRNHPDLPKDLFSDPESSQAQEAQEAILVAMVEETGKEFLQDLANRGQEQPAIITFDGFIVNGNRRTAALRMLHSQYIDCVVLPKDARPRDIYELEQVIQISREFREEYHWINELANISRGIRDKRFDYTEDEMAKRLRISNPELKAKLVMMDLVDAFLIWKGIPKAYDYSKLDDAEEIFRQLERELRKCSGDEPRSRELRNATFTLIENRPSKGRLYSHVTALFRDFDQIYERMKQASSPAEAKGTNHDGPVETEDDLIDEILEGTTESSPALFSDPQRAADVSPVLVETIKDVAEENKERKDTEAAYEAVSSAQRQLNAVVISSNAAKLSSIIKKLEEIQARAKDLLGQAKAIQKG